MKKKEILEKLLDMVMKLDGRLAKIERVLEEIKGFNLSKITITNPEEPPAYPIKIQPIKYPDGGRPIMVMYGVNIKYDDDGTLMVPESPKITWTSTYSTPDKDDKNK